MSSEGSNGGFFHVLVPLEETDIQMQKLRTMGILTIQLMVRQMPLILARVPKGRFGWFNRKISGLKVKPLLISHDEFESLIKKSVLEEKWTISDLELSNLEPETRDEIEHLIESRSFDQLMRKIEEMNLLIKTVELFDSRSKNIRIYDSGIIHVDENPARNANLLTSIKKAMSAIG